VAYAMSRDMKRRDRINSPAYVVLLCEGWLLVGAMMLRAIIFIDSELTPFSWPPKVDYDIGIAMLVYGAGLAGSILLHRGTRRWVGLLCAVGVVGSLAVLGAATIFPGRDVADPLWYRASRFGLLILPALIFFWQQITRYRSHTYDEPRPSPSAATSSEPAANAGWSVAHVVVICQGWLLVGAMMLGAMIFINLHLNLFNWQLKVDYGIGIAMLVYGAGLAGSILLHRGTRRWVGLLCAVGVVGSLAVVAATWLSAESLKPGSFLGRQIASPLWYRAGRFGLLVLPALILFWQQITRYRADSHDAPQPLQTAATLSEPAQSAAWSVLRPARAAWGRLARSVAKFRVLAPFSARASRQSPPPPTLRASTSTTAPTHKPIEPFGRTVVPRTELAPTHSRRASTRAIFISHSSEDEAVANQVRQWLVDHGYDSIFLDVDPEQGIPAGMDWEQELYQQLRSCQAVIVLCSEASMRSMWCFAEITQARSLGKHILPIQIGDCQIHSFLKGRQMIDLRTEPEEGFRRLWRGLLSAGLEPLDPSTWDRERPPYPGLVPFQGEDAAIFFGRDVEIQESIDRLNVMKRTGSSQVALVLGASGCGKSSLVRAGMLPRVRRDMHHWIVLDPFRPRDQPMRALAHVLATACADHGGNRQRTAEDISEGLSTPEVPEAAAFLVNLVRELTDGTTGSDLSVLMTIDQFEESLGTIADDPKGTFLAMLRTALDLGTERLILLATLRSDFLGAFQQHPLLAGLRPTDILVGPMSVEGLTQVIEKPAQVAGIELEDGLVGTILRDAETADALPLLAFILHKLYSQYGGDGRLTLEEYAQLGGLRNAVAQEAEHVLSAQSLSTEEERELHGAFLSMVRINDEQQFVRTLRRVSWDDLPQSLHPLLERFVRARILVAGRGAMGERTLELAHEALLRHWKRLTDWLDEDREFLLWRKRFDNWREAWETARRRPAALLRGPALAEARRWAHERWHALRHEDREFLGRSVRRQRLRRRLAAGTTMAVIGALSVATVVSVRLNWRAQAEARASRDAARLSVALQLQDNLDTKTAILREVEDPRSAPDWKTLALRALDDPSPRLTAVLKASGGGLRTADLSPDGRKVLSVSEDGAVQVWDISRTNIFLTLLRDVNSPTWAGFSPDGHYVLVTAIDGTARLWRADGTGSPVVFTGNDAVVLSGGFSPDGQRIVTASEDGTARVWYVNRSAEPVVLTGHHGAIVQAGFSPDGRHVVTASRDGSARVWSIDEEMAPVVLAGHDGPVVSASFSPDGQRIVTASEDGTARVWNADGSGEPVIIAAQFIALAPASGPFRKFDTFLPDVQGAARQLSDILPDMLITSDHRIWTFDGVVKKLYGDPFIVAIEKALSSFLKNIFRDPQFVQRIPSPLQEILGDFFSPDTVEGDEQRLGVWEKVVTTLSKSPATAKFNLLKVTGSSFLALWTAAALGQEVALIGMTGSLTSASFSPDGERVLLASAGGFAGVWNVSGKGEPVLLLTHTDGVYSAVFHPFGVFEAIDTVVTTSADHRVLMTRIQAPWNPRVLYGHEDEVLISKISQDGRRILTGSKDGVVRVWTVGSGLLLFGTRFEPTGVKSAVIGPEGRRVILLLTDGTAQSWSPRAGEPSFELRAYQGTVEAAVFSPDGGRVLIASSEGTMRLWNADGSGVPIELSGHPGSVLSVAFSPDGTRIVSGGADGTARLWRAHDGEPLILLQHQDKVVFVAFSPDGKRIVTHDGIVRVWNATGAGEPVRISRHVEGTPSFTLDSRQIIIQAVHENSRTSSQVFRICDLKEGEGSCNDLGWRLCGRLLDGWPKGLERPIYYRVGPDARHLVVGCGYEGEGRERRELSALLRTNRHGEISAVLRRYDYALKAATFSPDGKRVLIQWPNGGEIIWVDGSEEPVPVPGYPDPVHSHMSFSPDGRWLLVVLGGVLVTVRPNDGEPIQELLWETTSHCLSPERRNTLLRDSIPDARERYCACEKRFQRTPDQCRNN
jgi:WD40 repeat protein